MPEIPPYRGVLLSEGPTLNDLRAIVPDYEAMLITIMGVIADRYDRTPNYPFIDTKLDLITGEDFPADDPARGPNAIYGWIQGRGLEALAGHCRWMRRRQLGSDLLPRLEGMMREVLDKLRDMRARNGGHLFFFMTPDGDPFVLGADGVLEDVNALGQVVDVEVRGGVAGHLVEAEAVLVLVTADHPVEWKLVTPWNEGPLEGRWLLQALAADQAGPRGGERER